MTSAVKDFVMPEELREDAYYYGFVMTGVREIDQILSSVAMAGKSFHHTEDWQEKCYSNRQISPEELIQEMADRAAKAFREKT